MIRLYALTVFVGAALLFALEPLFVKMALPLFGGSPAVWNTAYVFFTGTLLLAYLYAHVLQRLARRRQVFVHLAVLLVAAIDLPIRLGYQSFPQLQTTPVLALFTVLVVRIGLPFFALAATGPLIGSWLYTASAGKQDPYPLFAASSLGSMAILLAYPTVIEPFVGLALTSLVWTGVYSLFVLLIARAGFIMLRSSKGNKLAHGRLFSNEIRRRTRFLWTALSAVPVALMIALTSHLSALFSPIPLVWTLPLTLYLLTFILVFWRAGFVRLDAVTSLVPYFLVPLGVLLSVNQWLTPVPYFALSLAAFFVVAFALHGRLAALRPRPEQLTEFYLWIAVGGLAGGVFSALIAPLVFSSILEYPILLVLACLLLPPGIGAIGARSVLLDLCYAAAFFAILLLLPHVAPIEGAAAAATTLLWVALGGGIALLLARRRLRFAGIFAALIIAGPFLPRADGPVLAMERNFFGTQFVFVEPTGNYHMLISGSTMHGLQAVDEGRSREPLAYYSPFGPLGDIFSAGSKRFAGRPIAVVGLGIGTVGCYRSKDQIWTYYEIDPATVDIARDPKLFTQLQACTPDAAIVLGDARISLSNEEPRGFALLVVDAYSGDTVPVHLLTREALTVYLRQIAPDGVLAFHISNRYFELSPILAALAKDAGLSATERRDDDLSARERDAGRAPSTWVVLTRPGTDLSLKNDRRWHGPSADETLPLWTDDYSSLLRVLKNSNASGPT